MSVKIFTGAAADSTYSTAGNWKGGAAPIAGDDVWFTADSVGDVTAGLDAHTVALNSFNVTKGYTGNIGTATAYLRVGAPILNIGSGLGQGSGRINIDTDTTNCQATVYAAGYQATDSGKRPVRIKLNHASATLNALGGSIALNAEPDETGQAAAINLPFGSGADVLAGPAQTVATISVEAGTLTVSGTISTSVLVQGGTFIQTGASAITTFTYSGGNSTLWASGTITTLTGTGGTCKTSGSAVAKTVTNCWVDGAAQFLYDPAVTTLTNGVKSHNPVALKANLPS